MATNPPTPAQPTGQQVTNGTVVAEPGYLTTEFWVSAASSGATLVGTIAVDFGFANFNGTQRADITAAAVFVVGIIAGAYSVARAIRKQGLI